MDFKDFLEAKGEVTEDTKRRIFEKATTIGIPVRRGVRPNLSGRPFTTDPGDFGRGIYYDTYYHRAKSYGEVVKSVIQFKNPLVLTADEAYKLSDKFQILHLPDEVLIKNKDPKVREQLRLENAQKMTDYMIAKGHDGLIVIFKKFGHLEIVDYRPYHNV